MIKYTLNREELYEFLDPIDSKMTKKIHAIIKSHEKHGGDESKELDKISDLVSKMFQDDMSSSVYILERTRVAEDGKVMVFPLSFVIYSTGRADDKNAHMELIYTNKKALNAGYAEMLVESPFKDLKEQGYTSVTSVVADDNIPSLNFNQKLIKKLADGRAYNRDNGTYGFNFDITKLKTKAKEMAD